MVLVASLENIGQIIEVLMRGDNNDTVIELDAIITVGDDNVSVSYYTSEQNSALKLKRLQRNIGKSLDAVLDKELKCLNLAVHKLVKVFYFRSLDVSHGSYVFKDQRSGRGFWG